LDDVVQVVVLDLEGGDAPLDHHPFLIGERLACQPLFLLSPAPPRTILPISDDFYRIGVKEFTAGRALCPHPIILVRGKGTAPCVAAITTSPTRFVRPTRSRWPAR